MEYSGLSPYFVQWKCIFPSTFLNIVAEVLRQRHFSWRYCKSKNVIPQTKQKLIFGQRNKKSKGRHINKLCSCLTTNTLYIPHKIPLEFHSEKLIWILYWKVFSFQIVLILIWTSVLWGDVRWHTPKHLYAPNPHTDPEKKVHRIFLVK